jgi:hypothetical protein
LIGGVKRAFSSGPSSRGSSSHSSDGSQYSTQSSSFVPHRMRPRGWSAILHMMMFLWPRTAMTFPSVAPRRWRSMSLSARENFVTLVYTMWSCSRGLEWMKSFPSSSELLVGENSMEGNRWLEWWMDDFATVQWKCKHPSTHIPAWCMTSSVTSGLTLMLKSCKDLSLGKVPGAHVWVLTCLFVPHRMRQKGWSAILHMMIFLWPRTAMTFPSVAPRRWRSMSLSARENLVTLVYTMWSCSRGMEWMKSFPSSSNYWLGKSLQKGTDDSSGGWMTLQPCNENASIHQLIYQHDAWPLRSLRD